MLTHRVVEIPVRRKILARSLGEQSDPWSLAKSEDWGKQITRLINAGHSWGEIQNYTIPQLKLFCRYTVELEQEKRAVMVADTAIAAQGQSKAIAKKIQELLGF